MPSSSTAFQTFKSTSYFPNLDGLRFICIAMVLWHHSQPIPWGQFRLADRGFLGVDFFFVLSGFLITSLLLREAERDGQFSLKQFYIRRILRILPVYVFVVTITGLYYWQVKGLDVGHLLPFYYLFLSNFLTEHIPMLEITWSLSVEEQYYLLWPLILLLAPSRWIKPVLVAAIAANIVFGAGWIFVAAPEIGPLTLSLPTATYAPILMGSFLAVVLNTAQGFEIAYRGIGSKWASFALLLFLVALLHGTPQNVQGVPNLLIHLTMTLVLAALVLRTDNPLSSVLQNPIIRRAGVISYGIYLYHLIGKDITLRVFSAIGIDNAWLVLFGYSLLSVAIAEASFRTLEAYFRRFRPKN